ncbi:MAG: xanthine dehydrogenase family protein molybdopterin-binding subunit, partial [Candidatus Hydrogenedentes bacterium]|nr:xanthine dehydrogenase family protein molybdopterin-binding subunit [Candidatus Hydrogenedentota bacterium]
MAKNAWPSADKRSLIGKRISRLDGPVKSTGRAKYAYDISRPGMIYARLLWAPHGAAKVVSIDTSGARQINGVVGAWPEMKDGEEVRFAGQVVASLAATSEEIAHEALKSIKVEYEVQTPQMNDFLLEKAEAKEQRDEIPDAASVDKAFEEAEVKIEAHYGAAAITHCCMEAHGQVAEYRDSAMYIWPSTQNVSAYAAGLAEAAGMPASQIHVDCQYMGGGFGSKFDSDQWGAICTRIAKETGKPVKLMLERDQELMAAGARPSAYANVRAGATKDGRITVWDSTAWGSGGMGGSRALGVPYIFG